MAVDTTGACAVGPMSNKGVRPRADILEDPVANVLAEVLAGRLVDVLDDILTDVWQMFVEVSAAGQMLAC
jgi:hypothetical protein